MRPTVDALAKHCRVITFSLADEPTSGARFDEASGIWSYVQQVSDVLDATGLRDAAICGISYGGLIAAAFAARHPDRVSSLILMSAIPPSWKPDARALFLMRAPILLSPLFCLGSLRMCPEICRGKGSAARRRLHRPPRGDDRRESVLAETHGASRAPGIVARSRT